MDTNMYPDMYWHMKDNSNKNSHTTPIRGNQIDIEEEDEGRCIPCNITSTSASNTKTWNNTNTGEKRRKKGRHAVLHCWSESIRSWTETFQREEQS